MVLLRLIHQLSAEPYWVCGAMHYPGDLVATKPLEISCTVFAKRNAALVIEGTYRHTSRASSHPFALSIPYEGGQFPECELRCAHLGTLSGRLYELHGEFVAVLGSKEGHALSCQFTLDDSGTFRAKGAVHAGKLAFAFVATGSPGPVRESLGNVVGIHSARRA